MWRAFSDSVREYRCNSLLARNIPGVRPTIDSGNTVKSFTFDQLSALVAIYYYFCQRALPALEEVMENFAELMQRLLEVQSGGRQRSPELIAEDARLMDGLQKRWMVYRNE